MSTTNFNAAANRAAFFRLVHHPVNYRLFLLSKLPAAFFSGLKVEEANETRCAVSVPYSWLTQNPFRSTYFACLSMAAEMSTGLLAMSNIYRNKPAISMLVTGMRAEYHKKAKGRVVFVCEEGLAVKNAVENAITALGAENITVQSVGYNSKREIVAHFWFTWSFKVKS